MDQQQRELRAIGERVADLRKSMGMSQADLAQAIGRHVNSLSGWERGLQQMGVLDLKEISKALGVSIAQIVDPSPPVSAIRKNSLYFISPDRIDRIRQAKSREDVLAMLQLIPPCGVVIEPQDVQVTEEQFDQTMREAAELFRQRTKGPIARLLAKLRIDRPS